MFTLKGLVRLNFILTHFKKKQKTTKPAEPVSVSLSATQAASKHSQGSLKALFHFTVVIHLHFSNELVFFLWPHFVPAAFLYASPSCFEWILGL